MYNSSSTILDTSSGGASTKPNPVPFALLLHGDQCVRQPWAFCVSWKDWRIGLEGYCNSKHMYTDTCTHFHTHTHKQKHLKTETLLTPPPPHHHHIHTPTLPTSSSHCSAPDCPSLLIRELYSSPWSADNEGCYWAHVHLPPEPVISGHIHFCYCQGNDTEPQLQCLKMDLKSKEYSQDRGTITVWVQNYLISAGW